MIKGELEYVELHCHSYFSLLDGASSPEALVERAVALGHPALALTDHNGLYGAVRFWRAARDRGLKPIIGAEVTVDGGHLTLLAETQRGYANLCRLLSAGQLAGEKGHPRLALDSLAAHTVGLICLSGCRQGAVASALAAGDRARARQVAGCLRDAFGPGSFWIEVQRHYLPTDDRLAADLADLARELGSGLVATNNVHYAGRAGQWAHDVLACTRHGTNLPGALAAGLLHPNSEQHLKSGQEMATLFASPSSPSRPGLHRALRNTLHLAGRCDVRLDFAAQRLPAFPLPAGHSPTSYLRHLSQAGLQWRFDPVPGQARAQLDHELAVIEQLDLAGYFLVVWDIVCFARERGIRCQGRGSAANSLVAYALGITPVDPLRHNLLFERFLNQEMNTMPDIDVDFAADQREQVIQYVYERYGEEHVGMVCNVVTYRARSAVRDAAKALAFPQDVVDRIAKSLDTRSPAEAAELLAATQGMADVQGTEVEGTAAAEGAEAAPGPQAAAETLPWPLLAGLLRQMEGVPRHLSIHVGGMVVTAAPLVEVVPLERATMPGRVVVQWDKDSVEDAGLIKIDLLSLRTLGAVDEALDHIREQTGVTLDLDRLPLDDPAVYDLLQQADTVGCFQVESRAQAQMLPKLRPTCFEDIVVGVALIRPGPIQGGMVHPYLQRRQARRNALTAGATKEPAIPLPPDLAADLAPTMAGPLGEVLSEALAETMGVIVFQEQVLRVAMAVAGFSPGEADRLRRAMSRSRSAEAMEALRARFLAGARVQGVPEVAAAEIWRQLAGFAGFGFCKSHAAAFALVAYQTLYLKAHYPAPFYCALLNHQPMGFYPPEVIAGDAQRHGVPVLGPDVNNSQVACTLEKQEGALGLRLGLRYVAGLGETGQTCVVERRGDRPFCDLAGFCRRTRLPRAGVESLIRAGAMDRLGDGDGPRTRRDLLWALGSLVYQEEGLDLDLPAVAVDLPHLRQAERLAWEYELLGLAPGDHVMRLYRDSLRAYGVLASSELADRPDGTRVRVAGWAVVRQRPPTAKGHVFVTLEDEEGLMNLIVRPQVFERYREALRNAPLLWVEGWLQREGRAISILVDRAAALGRPKA